MPRSRLLLGGAVAAGAVEVWLATRTALPGGILERRWTLFAEVAGWWAAFAVAATCVLRLPRRTALVLLWGLAVAVRLASVSEKAPLSDDLYRYAWDGEVQLQGIDPYRYPPNAEELRDLRWEYLWPADQDGEEPESRINREGVRTIYPPVAQVWFTALRLALPVDVPDVPYALVGLLVDLAVLAAVLALLRAWGRDERWAALYALAPLPALEAVQNAHVDGLAVLLVLCAALLDRRGRPLAAGVFLALAVLVKVYPAALLPLLLRGPQRVRVALAVAATSVASYVPHVLAVGTDVLGYLPGYLDEEQYDAGTRYQLLGLLGLSGTLANVVALLALAALGGWGLRTSLPFPDAAVRLFGGVLLVLTPVQPWYGLLLVALAAVARAPAALVVAAASYPLFFSVILDGDTERIGPASAAVAAAAAAVGLRAARRER